MHTTSHRPTLVSAWPQSCTSYPNCRLHPPSRANASSTSCGHAHYKPQVNISRCMARLTSSPCEPPELTLWTARRWQKQTNASATHSATCSTTSGAGTLVCTEASPQAAAQWPSPRPPSHVPSEASADGRASPRPPASAPSRPPGSWQGGPPTPNDETLPSMRSRFHVAVLFSHTPSRTKPPGAPWRARWLPLHPGPNAMRAETTFRFCSNFG